MAMGVYKLLMIFMSRKGKKINRHEREVMVGAWVEMPS